MEYDMRTAAEEMRQAALQAAASAAAATTAANASTAAANAATAAVHQVSRDVVAIRRDLGILWKHVKGTSATPTLGDPECAPAEEAGEIPLIDRINDATETASEASLEVAALEGRMIAGLAAVETKLMNELRPQSTELAKQSEDMGVGKHGLDFWRSKQGRQYATTILTLVVTALGLLANMTSGCTGHAPPAPAPVPTIIVAPAATPPPAPLLLPIPPPAVSR